MDINQRHFNAVYYLKLVLSENEMEILSDSLQCYGRHPEDHSYDDEIDDIRKLAFAFAMFGYNKVLPEYDILCAPEPSG